MTEKEREKAQKEREEALINEHLHARKLSKEEIDKLKKEGRI